MRKHIWFYSIVALLLASCVTHLPLSESVREYLGTKIVHQYLYISPSMQNFHAYYNEEGKHIVVYVKFEITAAKFMDFYGPNCKSVGQLFINDFKNLSSYLPLPNWWDVANIDIFGGTKCQSGSLIYDLAMKHGDDFYTVYLRLYIS